MFSAYACSVQDSVMEWSALIYFTIHFTAYSTLRESLTYLTLMWKHFRVDTFWVVITVIASFLILPSWFEVFSMIINNVRYINYIINHQWAWAHHYEGRGLVVRFLCEIFPHLDGKMSHVVDCFMCFWCWYVSLLSPKKFQHNAYICWFMLHFPNKGSFVFFLNSKISMLDDNETHPCICTS